MSGVVDEVSVKDEGSILDGEGSPMMMTEGSPMTRKIPMEDQSQSQEVSHLFDLSDVEEIEGQHTNGEVTTGASASIGVTIDHNTIDDVITDHNATNDVFMDVETPGGIRRTAASSVVNVMSSERKIDEYGDDRNSMSAVAIDQKHSTVNNEYGTPMAMQSAIEKNRVATGFTEEYPINESGVGSRKSRNCQDDHLEKIRTVILSDRFPVAEDPEGKELLAHLLTGCLNSGYNEELLDPVLDSITTALHFCEQKLRDVIQDKNQQIENEKPEENLLMSNRRSLQSVENELKEMDREYRETERDYKNLKHLFDSNRTEIHRLQENINSLEDEKKQFQQVYAQLLEICMAANGSSGTSSGSVSSSVDCGTTTSGRFRNLFCENANGNENAKNNTKNGDDDTFQDDLEDPCDTEGVATTQNKDTSGISENRGTESKTWTDRLISFLPSSGDTTHEDRDTKVSNIMSWIKKLSPNDLSLHSSARSALSKMEKLGRFDRITLQAIAELFENKFDELYQTEENTIKKSEKLSTLNQEKLSLSRLLAEEKVLGGKNQKFLVKLENLERARSGKLEDISGLKKTLFVAEQEQKKRDAVVMALQTELKTIDEVRLAEFQEGMECFEILKGRRKKFPKYC